MTDGTALPAAASSADAPPAIVPGGFGLYVHWPFCASKCPYCDFNSHVSHGVDQDSWRAGLLSELGYFGVATKGRLLETVFFGGGTPSLMPPSTVAAVLDALSTYWAVARDAEVTLEANPSSVEAKNFADFRAAGINRVSVGVQSFRDEDLKFLGRSHSAIEARNAVAVAEKMFDRVSFDMIYALPGQTARAWATQLNEALTFGTGHLSLYQLTIEKGTPFFSYHNKGMFHLPDDDLAVELSSKTVEMTEKVGLSAYEISNYSFAGQESRHNLTYWSGGDYIGIGPGAHGRLSLNGTRYRTEQVPLPENWLAAIKKQGHANRIFETISETEHVIESLMMGMRVTSGISRNLFERLTGLDLEDCVDRTRSHALVAAGLVKIDDEGIRATPEGRQRLNSVIEALIPDFC
ncbi:MAG: radical SAM family heme chaperone HemW [Pseudomonadota bacterium]|nr:radical SAM family heme chaperone HemW [Pseudomonadota bacterium]